MQHEADDYDSLLNFSIPTSATSNIHISIPLGIVIGLLASFVQSLGLTIQRKSHVVNQQLPEHAQRVETRRPLWLLGFGIFISSNILGSLVQIASLPVVILAPLGAVSLLWNAFFARILLGDVFSPWMILGTLLIAGGAVLIAIFGIVPEVTRSLEDLLSLLRRPTFVAYFSLLGAFVVISLVITHATEYSLHRRIKNDASLPPPPSSPSSPHRRHTSDPCLLTNGVTELTEGLATESTPLLDPKNSPAPIDGRTAATIHYVNKTRLVLAISYASFSGILSGMCLLFAKSGTELLLLTLGGENQFWRWQAWMLVLALVVFALLQLGYLHKALVLANPTLVCPSAFCFYNLSSIVNGLVYFDQFALIPPMHLGLVVVGIVILLSGVWVVSIQSGDGPVDGVPWSDTEEEMVEGVGEDTALTTSPTSDYVQDHEWGSRSEPTLSPSEHPASIGLGLDLSWEHGIPPQSTVSLADSSDFSLGPRSPRSPTETRRRPTFHDERSSSGRRHQRLPSHSNIQLSPPLQPGNTVSTLAGAGFQIGLSATSPGFAIVPMERRRRVSALSGHQDDEVPGPGGVGIRRHTLSEGDVLAGSADSTGQGLDVEDGLRGDSEMPARKRSRWHWLRRTSARGI